MHFRVSLFSSVASIIVLVLHLSCFTKNISASEFSLSAAEQNSNADLSEILSPDDNIFTTVPSLLDQEEVNETNSQPNVQFTLEEEPIIKQLPTADVSVKVDGELTIEKLPPQADNPLDPIDSYQQSQTEVSYEVNDSTNTERPDTEVSYEVKSESSTTTTQPAESSTKANKVAENPWIQRITSSKSRSLKLSRQNDTAKMSSGKPLMLGQIISNVLYGAPWLAPQTNSKCANDMRLYNIHVQNLTMWAFRSK